MLFTSLAFVVFTGAVVALTWLIGGAHRRCQNLLILLANIVFYATWDARFLGILYGAALMDYFIGRGLAASQNQRNRQLLLGISLTVNLGLLGLFKYFDFFALSFAESASTFGWHVDSRTLSLVLPLGISFYTFQRLSYSLDLYRRQIGSTHDLVAFLAFSSFFPLIMAGPIERAKRLLPQFERPRAFEAEAFKDGLRQILCGFLRKVLIADNLAPLVDRGFNDYSRLNGIDLGAVAFLFAIQIYADFAGYSDIAIGTGRLLGFRIARNFALPYFSRDIAEFWRNWHISMSSWFRDYVYTPLSMKVPISNRARRSLNIVITFAVSGLWHGAAWNYVVWGVMNGLFFLPLIWGRAPERTTRFAGQGRTLPAPREAIAIGLTFTVTTLAWIVFRSPSLAAAFDYFVHMFSQNWLAWPQDRGAVLWCAAYLGLEWFQRSRPHPFAIAPLPTAARWCLYCAALIALLVFGSFGGEDFFYAKF